MDFFLLYSSSKSSCRSQVILLYFRFAAVKPYKFCCMLHTSPNFISRAIYAGTVFGVQLPDVFH